MKARKNDKIVCGCADSAGHIRNDLKDADTITSDDLAIAVDMEDDGYKCKKCGKQVARLIGGGWTVRTVNGWIT